MKLSTYDIKSVACILGSDAITGFSEGEDVVKVEMAKELFQTIVGASGEATRTKSNNFSAKVTLKLLKTSADNDILNKYYQADRLSNSGTFPFLLKDSNGTELHSAEQMWIEKAPNTGHGENPSVNEWVLATHYMVSNFGGNV